MISPILQKWLIHQSRLTQPVRGRSQFQLRAAWTFYLHHAAFYKNILRVVTHSKVGVDYSDLPLIFLAVTILSLTNFPFFWFFVLPIQKWRLCLNLPKLQFKYQLT